MAPTGIIPKIPTSLRPPNTPPSSSALPACEQVLTLKHVQQFVELVKTVQATRTLQPPGEAPDPVKTEEASGDKQEVVIRASKLEFKAVNKIWDAKAYEYKIAESLNPADGLNGLDQYILVVHQRVDKRTINPTHYIDIKSEGLRDIRANNLSDNKPAVAQNLLYNYLSELDLYWNNASTGITHDPTRLKHLDLLVDFIKTIYESTTQRLLSLLENEEVTYNLLLALFKPNSRVYMTCFRTGKPRCVICDGVEENDDARITRLDAAVAADISAATQIINLLRWKATPFTLEWIGADLYCPRLIVGPETALSRILRPASYPLDIAVTLIHEYGGSGKSLPCEASRVLTVYDELHRLEFSDANITMLDPKLFDSSDYSLTEKKAFHKQVGGWIDFIGQGIEIPDVYVGKWHLETVQVDYTQLRMSLCLSKGFYRSVFPLPSDFSDPPRRQLPLQQYRDSRLDLPTLPLRNLSRGMLEDIIFCQYWMNKECNSEDICTVIVRRNNKYHLKPHHIDVIGCQIFQKSLYDEGSGLIRYVSDLSEEKLRQSKARFWKDFELAQRADPFMKW